MSMRIQAKLDDKLSSRNETSYLRQQNVIVLENVQAEMVFKTSQGFIEHESQGHDYLPCFHMIGEIDEIRGNFPFNTTSLYFSNADKQVLTKDIVYYPTPDELAHLIQTGKFYSRHFQVPEILKENTFYFPCTVNLVVVPPPDEVAYQTMVVSNFTDLEDEEKVNLPLFYVGLLGTGVTRKNDRLLDYYGIDAEPGYDQYVLTAESSGYTKPTLMEYIEEPIIEEEAEKEDLDEYYISPEEEAEMLQSAEEAKRQAEREAEEQVVKDVQAEYHEATPEDALIAKIDRDITRRMEKTFGGRRLSLDAKREVDKAKAAEIEAQKIAEEQVETETEVIAEEHETTAETDVKDVKAEIPVVSPEPVVESEAVEDVEPERDAKKQSAEMTAEDLHAMEGEFIGDEQRAEPETPEQQADVKMDVTTDDTNEYVSEEHEEIKAEQEAAEEFNQADVSDLMGADVEDTELQAAVEEAEAEERAKDAAVAQQQTSVEDYTKTLPPDAERKQPEQKQEQAEIKMDLDPEKNSYIKSDDGQTEKSEESGAAKREDGITGREAGADVADAAEQVKVDEAHQRDLNRDVAVSKHREVPDDIQRLADEYGDSLDTDGPDDEYI